MRLGGTNHADKYRIEARNRRRKTDESLAFPELEHRACETIECDYFIDELVDPDFPLMVRERLPSNTDSALRIAVELEVWTKDVDRIRNEKKTESFCVISRKVTRTNSFIKTKEELRKQVTELQIQSAQATLTSNGFNPVGDAERHVAERSGSNMRPRPKDFACWVVAAQTILFGCFRIRRQKREDITIRGKFGI